MIGKVNLKNSLIGINYYYYWYTAIQKYNILIAEIKKKKYYQRKLYILCGTVMNT